MSKAALPALKKSAQVPPPKIPGANAILGKERWCYHQYYRNPLLYRCSISNACSSCESRN
jgi:hypothetical protein